MLKQQAKLFNKFSMLLDAAIVLVAFRLAYYVRAQWGGLQEINNYFWLLLVFLPAGFYMFTHYDLYSSIRTRSLSNILYSLLKTHIIVGVIIAACIYVYEPQRISRGLFFLFLPFSYLFLAAEKIAEKRILEKIRKKGYNFRNILIVGTGTKAELFAVNVIVHSAWGLKIVGFLQASGEAPIKSLLNYPVFGGIDSLVQVCRSNVIDEVVFCPTMENVAEIEDYLVEMEELGITVRMALDFFELRRSRREVTLFHDEIPVMTFYRRAFNAERLFLKRCLDVAGALAGLIMTLIYLPFIAIAIRIESAGPIFFGQLRVGENGRTFKCWKFRSMYVDAEKRKKELMDLNEVKGAMFKIKDDPRVTKVGKFLRKTSLDEIPQFWNVLRGEMSLVGTRPPTPDEVAGYENWHRRRICIKPGLTGLWQVSGRNMITDFDDIVRLDLEYIDNWSLWLDIKILFKTIGVVFLREGSH